MGKLVSNSGKRIEVDQTEEGLKRFGINAKPDQEFHCIGCSTHSSNPCRGIIKGIGKGGLNSQIDVIYMLLTGKNGVTFCPNSSFIKKQFPK